jgi:DNA mismatch repair protein MutL
MPKIQVLSPFVADLIAAGEVVERPASVVKELLENSLDAGAKNIVLELRGGGRSYIRVTDDGCGMSPEDAGVAFLRHATSKLRDERGLEAIGTLGFRGEALAAVGAVSRIELTTRERGAPVGVRVGLLAGEIQDMYETGCPEGTTMLVRDLFFNTPARLKFMGSDKAEGGQCVNAALRCALGRPDVSFRCLKDGEEVFYSPGDGREDSCVYSLLGRETAASFLPCRTDDGTVRVHGYISSPARCRGSRAGQFFFCNGRSIRSRALQTALEQAYKNCVMTGRFPACALYVELSCASVDVNVHPAKTEVKFSDEKRVFDGVYYAALAALGAEDRLSAPDDGVGKIKASPPERPLSASGGFAAAARNTGAAAFGPDACQSVIAGERCGPAPSAALRPAPPLGASPRSGLSVRDAAAPYGVREPAIRHFAPKAEEKAPEQTLLGDVSDGEPFRLLGEALGVYIVLQQGDRLVLIDKHAVHERILFDRLLSDKRPVMSQGLLLPAVFTPGGEGAELLLRNGDLLVKLGFVLEPFGEEAVALRAVPADMDAAEAVPALEEMLEHLREGRNPGVRDVREKLAATIACRAAVKAGDDSDPKELLALAKRVLSGEIKYCPHGRPVSAVLTRAELDRKFGRIQ